MKTVDKVANVVVKIVELAVIILFTITLSCCVLQVFTRYVLNDSLRWTEELARYTFIYGNVLGAVLMQRAHGHAVVSVIIDRLPEKARKFWDIAINFVMLAISAVLVYSGIQVFQRTTRQITAGLGIPMCYVYMSIIIGGALLVFFISIEIMHQIEALMCAQKESSEEGSKL